MSKKYKLETLTIDQIVLDESNPRFAPADNQIEAINIMIQDQDSKILVLSEDIYLNGLNPSNRLIIFKENGELVDGDGNRRLTCLKLLETPTLAKGYPKIEKGINNILKKDGIAPFEVDCVIFNSRDEANHWIRLNHSGVQEGKGQISWSSEQKNRFENRHSVGLQAMDELIKKGLLNDNDKKELNKSTVDRLLNFSSVKKLLLISKVKDIYTFGNLKNLTKVLLYLKGKSVDVVYTAAKGDLFVREALSKNIENENSSTEQDENSSTEQDENSSTEQDESSSTEQDESSSTEQDESSSTEQDESSSTEQDESSSTEQDESSSTEQDESSSTEQDENNNKKKSKSRRTKENPIPIFGKPLILKAGDVNNIYRDIEAIYDYYIENRENLSSNFMNILRLSLRLAVENACEESEETTLDKYIKKNFDLAKKALSREEKTFLNINNVEKDSLTKLLHVGAHNYKAAQNKDQTLAISLIIGQILTVTHGKDDA
ncbi:hypothetical protein [uncultured Psychrobacter sp.]|uniref:hypothetical protein n=1 Tax=uncultured Psychrobacter sp. TaxID=259303 RepID=UPI002596B232|nr:hypothetical protein [uncultured Psychrobacter sp.]